MLEKREEVRIVFERPAVKVANLWYEVFDADLDKSHLGHFLQMVEVGGFLPVRWWSFTDVFVLVYECQETLNTGILEERVTRRCVRQLAVSVVKEVVDLDSNGQHSKYTKYKGKLTSADST